MNPRLRTGLVFPIAVTLLFAGLSIPAPWAAQRELDIRDLGTFNGLESVGTHPRELLEYLRGCGFAISQAGSRHDTSITDLGDFEKKMRMLRITNLLLTRKNKPQPGGPGCKPS